MKKLKGVLGFILMVTYIFTDDISNLVLASYFLLSQQIQDKQ